MAKMLPILGDIKGSIGGLTFRKSMSGPMTVSTKARANVNGTIGPPGAIDRNRALIGYLSRSWSVLEPEEREAWRDWASNNPQPDGFGGTFIMSGINAFVMLNHTVMRLDVTAEFESMPPIAVPPGSLNTVTIVTGALVPGITATWTLAGVPAATDYIEIATSGPYVSGGKSKSLKWVMYTTVAGNLLTVELPDLSPSMWYWVRGRYVSADGQRTPWLSGQALAAA